MSNEVKDKWNILATGKDERERHGQITGFHIKAASLVHF